MKRGGNILLTGGSVLTEERGLLEDGVLLISSEGRLLFVGTREEYQGGQQGKESLDLDVDETVQVESGSLLVPGFVDIHVHGGGGADFMDASAEAYQRITAFHGRNGTTAMLATTVTATKDTIERVLEAVQQISRQRHKLQGARLWGVHLEGPFISPRWPGAQNPSAIQPPRTDWLELWCRTYPGLLRIVTLAPEAEGALEAVAWLSERGITPSAGHTDADYAVMKAAAELGLCHAVHTFNAMKGLHHREPGAAGAVLTEPRIRAEVIADGHHVHPACVSLLARCKGPEGLILITDAISAAGMGDGVYQLGGLDVTVSEGVARLTDGGALAGSTLTMIEAFRFAIRQAGLSLADASRAASGNPARAAGLFGEVGSLTAGKRADFLVLDRDLAIREVWIGGFQRSEGK